MIKTVIFDIDNTLYDYDSAHLFGMEALTAYCIKEFHISEQQIRSCYDKAMKIMAKRIGTDSAAIHSRMLRFQCMTELFVPAAFSSCRKYVSCLLGYHDRQCKTFAWHSEGT